MGGGKSLGFSPLYNPRPSSEQGPYCYLGESIRPYSPNPTRAYPNP